MKDGFVRVSAVTPHLIVGDTRKNGEEIRSRMREAAKMGSKITVFPELSITGYTCQDLFFQERLLDTAEEELMKCARLTEEIDGLYFIGLPYRFQGKLYNVAAVLNRGRVLGLVPKKNLPNYHEFYERRQFTPGFHTPVAATIAGQSTRFGIDLHFQSDVMRDLVVACELCEDLWVPNPPSIAHAMGGATVIANLSASDELTGKADYRRSLVTGQSARLYTAYIYASAGIGESTQDLVFSGHDIIAEAGRLRQENLLYREGIVTSEIDIGALVSYRRQMTTYVSDNMDTRYETILFSLQEEETVLTSPVDPAPFVPHDKKRLAQRCQEILDIQAYGLRKRLQHTHAKTAVIGISGGLDSTLALLVTARAFDLLGLSHEGIIAVTMPGFGTTDRTYQNAVSMVQSLGATLREVSIVDAVNQHFKDIDQNPSVHDVTYENSQARERTQILMDIANKEGGLVIGTGDLSELALGWATYNGDHMSMYAVNASVPKTLVRFLVRHVAETSDEKLKQVLLDVLDTPVSPELLPPENGVISQKTEDLVGPYELHDFFLYYVMRFGFSPRKIDRLARVAFEGAYDTETIHKWMATFYKRFFSQQFKRSCLPDGPKVGTVALSPRGDWRMPSDAVADAWMEEVNEL